MLPATFVAHFVAAVVASATLLCNKSLVCHSPKPAVMITAQQTFAISVNTFSDARNPSFTAKLDLIILSIT